MPRIGHLSLIGHAHTVWGWQPGDRDDDLAARNETSISGLLREFVLTEEQIMMSLGEVNWDRNKFNASSTALPHGS